MFLRHIHMYLLKHILFLNRGNCFSIMQLLMPQYLSYKFKYCHQTSGVQAIRKI